jgi:copper(I)-binding protein
VFLPLVFSAAFNMNFWLLGLLPLAIVGFVQSATAHGYRFGKLEILHPIIMVPSGSSDCTCAHVKIVNHGPDTEFFLGASITAASRTHLIELVANGDGIITPARVAIPPGGSLDLSQHHWCLFMSGITKTLEADVGVIKGQIHFETQGTVDIEFMIAPATY